VADYACPAISPDFVLDGFNFNPMHIDDKYFKEKIKRHHQNRLNTNPPPA
jgi:hypothetical protein